MSSSVGYPENYDMFILVNAAGSFNITEMGLLFLKSFFSDSVKRIINRLVPLILETKRGIKDDDTIITLFDVIMCINENVNLGDYSNGYYKLMDIDRDISIRKHNDRSCMLLTNPEEFQQYFQNNLDAILTKIDTITVKEDEDKFNTDNYTITKNAIDFIQKYVEREVIEFIKKAIILTDESYLLNIKTFVKTIKVLEPTISLNMKIPNRIVNIDFYDQICNFIDENYDVDDKFDFKTIDEINHILNCSLGCLSSIVNKFNGFFNFRSTITDYNFIFTAINTLIPGCTGSEITSRQLERWEKRVISKVIEENKFFSLIEESDEEKNLVMIVSFLEKILDMIHDNISHSYNEIIDYNTKKFYFLDEITNDDLKEFLYKINYSNIKLKCSRQFILSKIPPSGNEPIYQPVIDEIKHDFVQNFKLKDFVEPSNVEDRYFIHSIIDNKLTSTYNDITYTEKIKSVYENNNSTSKSCLRPFDRGMRASELDKGTGEIVTDLEHYPKSYLLEPMESPSKTEETPIKESADSEKIPDENVVDYKDDFIRYRDTKLVSTFNPKLIETINSITLRKTSTLVEDKSDSPLFSVRAPGSFFSSSTTQPPPKPLPSLLFGVQNTETEVKPLLTKPNSLFSQFSLSAQQPPTQYKPLFPQFSSSFQQLPTQPNSLFSSTQIPQQSRSLFDFFPPKK